MKFIEAGTQERDVLEMLRDAGIPPRDIEDMEPDPNFDKTWLVLTKRDAFIVFLPGSEGGHPEGEIVDLDYRDGVRELKRIRGGDTRIPIGNIF